jgi:hypothetical protein
MFIATANENGSIRFVGSVNAVVVMRLGHLHSRSSETPALPTEVSEPRSPAAFHMRSGSLTHAYFFAELQNLAWQPLNGTIARNLVHDSRAS